MEDMDKAFQRSYYQAHKEVYRRYYQTHREERRAYYQRYYREHREEYLAARKAYQERRQAEGWTGTETCQKCQQKNKARIGESQLWIRDRRLELGYSQKALAKLLGVSDAHISRLERGYSPLETFRQREKLMEILEVKT